MYPPDPALQAAHHDRAVAELSEALSEAQRALARSSSQRAHAESEALERAAELAARVGTLEGQVEELTREVGVRDAQVDVLLATLQGGGRAALAAAELGLGPGVAAGGEGGPGAPGGPGARATSQEGATVGQGPPPAMRRLAAQPGAPAAVLGWAAADPASRVAALAYPHPWAVAPASPPHAPERQQARAEPVPAVTLLLQAREQRAWQAEPSPGGTVSGPQASAGDDSITGFMATTLQQLSAVRSQSS